MSRKGERQDLDGYGVDGMYFERDRYLYFIIYNSFNLHSL